MKKIFLLFALLLISVIGFFAYNYFNDDIKYYFINKKIEEANYCRKKDDCTLVEKSYPFGCHTYVNKNEKQKISKLINSLSNKCIHDCDTNYSFDCIQNKCKISKKKVLKIEDIKKLPEKEEIKKNELTVHFDYPVIENSEIDKLIKFWGENFIKDTKKEYKEKSNIENPELYFYFEIHKNNYVNSIVYRIEKHIYNNHPEKFSKVFYINKDGKILDSKDLLGKDYENITKLLEEKITKKDINYFKEDIKQRLKKYIKEPKLYFDKNNVYFIFDEYEIAPYSEGKIIINFKIEEFRNFLNQEIFTDLNKIKNIENKILKKQEKNIEKKQEKKENTYDNSKKYIALTFDDGPGKTLTPKLLDILKKHRIKATFCVLGKNTSYFPEIVKREFDEGHEICNHSWSHPNLTKLSEKRLKKEIEDTDKKIIEIIGEKSKLFRPPYGIYNDKVKKTIGRTILIWNVDSIDWKNRNVEKNIKSVEKDIKDGSIILFHDIHKESVETIDPLIEKLKKENYEFITVTELLKMGQKDDFSNKVCFGKYDCK